MLELRSCVRSQLSMGRLRALSSLGWQNALSTHVTQPAPQNRRCSSADLPSLTPYPAQGLLGNTFILSSSFSRQSLAHTETGLQILVEWLIQVVGRLLQLTPSLVTSGILMVPGVAYQLCILRY